MLQPEKPKEGAEQNPEQLIGEESLIAPEPELKDLFKWEVIKAVFVYFKDLFRSSGYEVLSSFEHDSQKYTIKTFVQIDADLIYFIPDITKKGQNPEWLKSFNECLEKHQEAVLSYFDRLRLSMKFWENMLSWLIMSYFLFDLIRDFATFVKNGGCDSLEGELDEEALAACKDLQDFLISLGVMAVVFVVQKYVTPVVFKGLMQVGKWGFERYQAKKKKKKKKP